MTLMEALIVSVIIAIVALPTIDLMSKMVVSEDTFNNDINSKENKTAVTEKIITSVMPASYIYPANKYIIIPRNSGNYVSVATNRQTLAVLIPKFLSDGSLNMPSSTQTSFKGIAFSIIPESIWNGGNSSKYVLVQTVIDDPSFNLTIDPNDTLKITTSPPINWSQGKSFIIATNLKPAVFTNQTMAFNPNSLRNSLQFSFVPMADGLYFSSAYGSKTINDSKFVSSVNLRNWRDTTY